MDEPGFGLKEARVCIVGLGLMGGSLALAMRDGVSDLTAVDADQAVCDDAVSRGIVRLASRDLSLVEEANLVMLATPMRALLRLVDPVGQRMRRGAVLLDLGSVKQPVVAAMNRLPDHIGAVAGHPMCGREVAGLTHADGTLYRGARFVLCRTDRTTPASWSLAGEVVKHIGACGLEMEAAHHDRVVGVTSHLPYMLSAVLAEVAGHQAASVPSVWTLAASGFRDASRLAGSDPTMMADVLLTNAPAALRAISLAQARLNELAALIEDADAERLLAALSEAQMHRHAWEGSLKQAS